MFGVHIMKRPIFNFKTYFNVFKQTLQIKHSILFYTIFSLFQQKLFIHNQYIQIVSLIKSLQIILSMQILRHS